MGPLSLRRLKIFWPGGRPAKKPAWTGDKIFRLSGIFPAVNRDSKNICKDSIIMKKLLFAINPHAGKGEIKTKALEVIDQFAHAGYEVTVHTTQRRREITHLLAGRAALYDLVVGCGGDGTLNETIDGLMHSGQRPPLGYIPAGTVNDFASSLGISKNI